jgi:hypothetical protein
MIGELREEKIRRGMRGMREGEGGGGLDIKRLACA